MTSTEFRDRLSARARKAGVSIAPGAQDRLETYFRLLARWNAKINLTALPLQRPTDETFDRLLIEPFAAARYVSDSARTWLDIGSGGGSPAIPLKIAHRSAKLTMVESRGRKAAFLREAVREVGLPDALVANDRFENVANSIDRGSVDLVTVRAVRADPGLFATVHRLLSPAGRTFLFHSRSATLSTPAGFLHVQTVELGTVSRSKLSVFKAVFHVEQNKEQSG